MRYQHLSRGILAAVIVVSLFASIGCAGSLQHKLTAWVDQPLYKALSALDKAEWTAYRAGLLPENDHAAANPMILKLHRVGKDINELVDVMKSSMSAPQILVDLVQQAISTIEDFTRLVAPGSAAGLVAELEKVRAALMALSPLIPLIAGGGR